jgi:hypothetical protein
MAVEKYASMGYVCSGLYYKSFTIVINNLNGQYYKTIVKYAAK